ncbi:unnamed protein product [Phyllotreta striolata]|uniref:Uncharacterized protein n=1 Tax=Phyllotreta striolata TaxID=444603 RepID=A0A9N9TEZ1_PHYSR|nr:unnamed protein product [Phyllotreta striolata]
MELSKKEIAEDLFLTVTHKDFRGTPKKRRPTFVPFEYNNPITEAYRIYLKLDPEEGTLVFPEDDADEYLLKVRENKKKIGEMHFSEPLNHPLIKKEQQLIYRQSLYRKDYCKYVKRKEKLVLPDDWKLPETTIQDDFRDPSIYDKTCFSNPTRLHISPTSLGQDRTRNEILKVTTGTTAYEDYHSKLGEIIIRKKLFGKITRPNIMLPSSTAVV